MRRITRNALLMTAGSLSVVGVVGVLPTSSAGINLAAGCAICGVAADAVDDLLGGIVPPPYDTAPGDVIRGGGDQVCGGGATGGPLPDPVRQQVVKTQQQVCSIS